MKRITCREMCLKIGITETKAVVPIWAVRIWMHVVDDVMAEESYLRLAFRDRTARAAMLTLIECNSGRILQVPDEWFLDDADAVVTTER